MTTTFEHAARTASENLKTMREAYFSALACDRPNHETNNLAKRLAELESVFQRTMYLWRKRHGVSKVKVLGEDEID